MSVAQTEGSTLYSLEWAGLPVEICSWRAWISRHPFVSVAAWSLCYWFHSNPHSCSSLRRVS